MLAVSATLMGKTGRSYEAETETFPAPQKSCFAHPEGELKTGHLFRCGRQAVDCYSTAARRLKSAPF
jgi:hypothetical protein